MWKTTVFNFTCFYCVILHYMCQNLKNSIFHKFVFSLFVDFWAVFQGPGVSKSKAAWKNTPRVLFWDFWPDGNGARRRSKIGKRYGLSMPKGQRAPTSPMRLLGRPADFLRIPPSSYFGTPGWPIFLRSPRVLFSTPGVVKIGFLTPRYSDFNR